MAHTIALKEVEAAVAAAVSQVESLKAHTNLSKEPIIMGRWLRDAHFASPAGLADLTAAAQHITDQVNAKVAGLKATPFAQAGHGGATMGFILHVETL